jgi:hypothetical protein
MISRLPLYKFFSFAVLVAAFLLVGFLPLDGLSLLPGNIGDARFNNYALENVYQFVKGGAPSLFHPTFFYPFPYVIGFSENLFGSSPIYLIARVLVGESDTAFQVWYLAGYIVNFLAAYYALRKLDRSEIASAVGALIFAFALPVTAQSGHAQLHYRFAVPLSITSYIVFLREKKLRYLVSAGAWLVWQFYCSLYIGFFLLLFLLAATFVHLFSSFFKERAIWAELKGFVCEWRATSATERIVILAAAIALGLLMGLLFYPYIQVSRLYSLTRSWHEIVGMLPRPQSYFLSDNSWLWASQSKVFETLPLRQEHQMFVGAIPMLLAFLGFLVGSKRDYGAGYVLLSGSLAVLVLLTLNIAGGSFWYLFAKLPLASSIRAMARIGLVFLFPVAFLGSVAIDRLLRNPTWGNSAVILLAALLIFEFSATSQDLSLKDQWRSRLLQKDQTIPTNLPSNPVLFFAQSNGPFYADELDAMWVAMKRGLPTLNGYSGFLPPGYYSWDFGRDCSEVPKRIVSFLRFSGQQNDRDAYRKLAHRVVPIGFVGCDPQWLTNPPPYSTSNQAYTADEFRKLSLHYVGRENHYDQLYVVISIANSGNTPISAASSIGRPVRISWRFIDLGGRPLGGWETRKDLTSDVPANGKLDVKVPIDRELANIAGTMEVSIVQELVFWGHDVGISPLVIELKSR